MFNGNLDDSLPLFLCTFIEKPLTASQQPKPKAEKSQENVSKLKICKNTTACKESVVAYHVNKDVSESNPEFHVVVKLSQISPLPN